MENPLLRQRDEGRIVVLLILERCIDRGPVITGSLRRLMIHPKIFIRSSNVTSVPLDVILLLFRPCVLGLKY